MPADKLKCAHIKIYIKMLHHAKAGYMFHKGISPLLCLSVWI